MRLITVIDDPRAVEKIPRLSALSLLPLAFSSAPMQFPTAAIPRPARPLAEAPRVGPKPSTNRQHLKLDTLVLLRHHPAIMSETENQFSLTGAASITGGAAKSKFLSVNMTGSRRVAIVGLAGTLSVTVTLLSLCFHHTATQPMCHGKALSVWLENYDMLILVRNPKWGQAEWRQNQQETDSRTPDMVSAVFHDFRAFSVI